MTVVLEPDPHQPVFKHAKFCGEEVDERFNDPALWHSRAVNSGIRAAVRYGKIWESNI